MLVFKLASQSEAPFLKAVPKHTLPSPPRQGRLTFAQAAPSCKLVTKMQGLGLIRPPGPRAARAKGLLTLLAGPSLGPEQVSKNAVGVPVVAQRK